MSNKFKDTDIKHHTYYFSDDIIKIKFFDQIKLKERKSHTKNYSYMKYLKINSANPL